MSIYKNKDAIIGFSFYFTFITICMCIGFFALANDGIQLKILNTDSKMLTDSTLGPKARENIQKDLEKKQCLEKVYSDTGVQIDADVGKNLVAVSTAFIIAALFLLVSLFISNCSQAHEIAKLNAKPNANR